MLAAEAEALAPGRALDLGCGEGGDAVWLAQRGWQVTAVDVAPVALERGAAHAAEAGIEGITWEHHDLARTFPDGAYDLVSAQFFQSPIELPRDEVLHRAAAAVAPRGRFIMVSHAAAPSWSEHAHVQFPTPEEELASLALDPAEWEVLRCEVAERTGTGPDGQAGGMLDAVVLARRRPA